MFFEMWQLQMLTKRNLLVWIITLQYILLTSEKNKIKKSLHQLCLIQLAHPLSS